MTYRVDVYREPDAPRTMYPADQPRYSTYNTGRYSHYDDSSCCDDFFEGLGNVISALGTVLEVIVEKVFVVLFRVLVFIVEMAFAIVNCAFMPINWALRVTVGYFFNRDKPYDGVILDRTAFARAPEPFNIHELGERGRGVNVGDLVKEYRNIHGSQADNNLIHNLSEYMEYHTLSGTGTTEIGQLQSLVTLANSSNSVPREEASARQRYNYMYIQTVKVAVQNIILELRNPETSVDKKKRALSALAEAQWLCPPRRLAECLRQYRLLRTSSPEMVQLLLGYLQDLKEEIFLTGYQGDQFHVINYIRASVGEEFGLDTSPVNIQDPYRGAGGRPFGICLRAYFYFNYTAQRVVEAVKTRIQLDENNQVCTEHIHAELRRQAMARGEDPNSSEQMAEEAARFFDFYRDQRGLSQSRINDRGVIFLLKSIGILIPA